MSAAFGPRRYRLRDGKAYTDTSVFLGVHTSSLTAFDECAFPYKRIHAKFLKKNAISGGTARLMAFWQKRFYTRLTRETPGCRVVGSPQDLDPTVETSQNLLGSRPRWDAYTPGFGLASYVMLVRPR